MSNESETIPAVPTSVASGELLDSVLGRLYVVAAELGQLRDRLVDPQYTRCQWEIRQTMRALAIAAETIICTKKNEPLPTLEDIQAIYGQIYPLNNG